MSPSNTALYFSDAVSGRRGSAMLVERLATSSDKTSLARLHVDQLVGTNQIQLFKALYNQYIKPSYPESEDYAEFVLERHFASADAYGYFTKKKTIWCLQDHQQTKPLGFTVVSEKRGGSIKFGPTVLIRDTRGLGIGPEFRLLVESRYPLARKAYNTLPDDNPAALSYVLKAGYRVEAHLAGQYREQRGEFVVGKLLGPATSPPNDSPVGRKTTGRLIVRDGNELAAETRLQIVCDLLRDSYDEVDAGFVRAIERASRTDAIELSKKTKRLFIAFRDHSPIGLVVVTPKRGYALKCSPFVLRAPDSEAFENLLSRAYSAFPTRLSRKAYFHVPYSDMWLSSEARSHGFVIEGLLREPYKRGVDMVVFGRYTGA